MKMLSIQFCVVFATTLENREQNRCRRRKSVVILYGKFTPVNVYRWGFIRRVRLEISRREGTEGKNAFGKCAFGKSAFWQTEFR